MYTNQQLQAENEAFAGTGGVSQNNHQARFLPAFRDSESGRVEMARLEDGQPASVHLLVGLPREWATGRDEQGHIVAVRATIIAGFVRDGVFYTREEAAVLS